MLKPNIENILNSQVEKEAYSSNLYLAMASWVENKGFEGTAAWLYEHSDEERSHMLKFVKYINDRGGNAIIPEIKMPPTEFSNVDDMFKDVLSHEQYITESINKIVEVCMDEKDFTTLNWIQLFVTEQIEEEALVNGIIDKLNLLDGSNMYLFDKDMKAGTSETIL